MATVVADPLRGAEATRRLPDARHPAASADGRELVLIALRTVEGPGDTR